MSKTDPVAEAKETETHAAQALYAEAQSLAEAGKDLRDRMQAFVPQFAGPAKIMDAARRELDGSVRPSRKARAEAAAAAKASAKAAKS